MPRPPSLDIDPPLLNSANPWATDLKDLTDLYKAPETGAVTTRTSLIKGFRHDAAAHQYTFFDAAEGHGKGAYTASVNSLGYSPYTLDEYLAFIREVLSTSSAAISNKKKGFIISVTGDPGDVAECYRRISSAQRDIAVPLAMEINLSCPNIPNAPPPAYDGASLLSFLDTLRDVVVGSPNLPRIPFGLKTPPYTHSTEFQVLVDALRTSAGQDVCPVSFITATNTLGSCLVLSSAEEPAPVLPGSGLGGMAGAPLHPLALGNVATIRRMLDQHSEQLGHIQIIGVGGVLDSAGFARMKSVGAYAVGVGTGLGIKGVGIFREIAEGMRKT